MFVQTEFPNNNVALFFTSPMQKKSSYILVNNSKISCNKKIRVLQNSSFFFMHTHIFRWVLKRFQTKQQQQQQMEGEK